MPQPDSDRAALVPGGSITERLLAPGAGLARLCEPLGDRYAAGDPGRSDGGGFSKYPGWDEQPHPWSQRAGSGHTARGAGGAGAGSAAESGPGCTDALGGLGGRR